jgi:hypothetical protein
MARANVAGLGIICFRPRSFSLATSSRSRYLAPAIRFCLNSSLALRGEPGMYQVASMNTALLLTSLGETSSGAYVEVDIRFMDGRAKTKVDLKAREAGRSIMLTDEGQARHLDCLATDEFH